MEQVYLISKTTLLEFEDISVHVKPERINVFVKKAQDLDLKPFLGHPFYYDLLKHFNADGSYKDAAPQIIKDFFDGCEYTDPHGHTIYYEGLKPTLVYFTFARFVEADAVRYTQTGPVIKSHDNAEPIKVSEITKLVQQQRSVANAHANEVEKFLLDNSKNYPLWRFNQKNKSSRQPGPRIRSVDRTNYNAGPINNNNPYPNSDFLL